MTCERTTKNTESGGEGVAQGGGATAPGSRPAHHVPDPGLFLGPKFRNPWETFEDRTLGQVMEWSRQRKKDKINTDGYLVGNMHPTPEDYRRAFPLHPVDWQALAAGPPPGGIQAVWVGHATVLVQMGGVTFITDPCFNERCSFVQFAGPRRVVPSALTGTEPQLPHLDFVLLSHNHYDHLDTGSVRTLNKRYGKALTWYVPLGLGSWFRSEDVECVVELDWWQSVQHQHRAPPGRRDKGAGDKQEQGSSSGSSGSSSSEVTVTMVPAQHWSMRTGLDRCRTLWGGYVVTANPTPSSTSSSSSNNVSTSTPATAPAASATVSVMEPASSSAPASESTPASPSGPATAMASSKGGGSSGSSDKPLRFYFVGDTGYCSVFKEIGERFGGIDLAAIPIGAYEPRWFMRPQHTNAEEGLMVAQDVRAAVSIGIHTATWSLTDEPLDEPPARLVASLAAAGLPADSFVTLQHGERAVVVGGRLVNSPATLPVADSPAIAAAAAIVAADTKAAAEAKAATKAGPQPEEEEAATVASGGGRCGPLNC
ncbi:hypothetical protein HYH02_013748 [Chlamydomonas schloesseri]|uniref:Metallo-beta-lactamase domain-containing protein n=1 Tax=Chlamydomonas schloesseri TaxID=2026947 RepID=A0A835T2I8_9CHLO|nr:hypothetical protein HYH02_013748 [Chlamydomonas schloesseri]|eukprot:KAG2430386.1 hypothetical protein HYH02_013748 [Chlamydomonas schloesseri]